MISVFRPVPRAASIPPILAEYDGNSDTTPILPFNYTIEGLNRDVYVKPLHSHNDYWRSQPLFDALSIGAVSVESDVWYFPQGFNVSRTVTQTSDDGLTQTKSNVTHRFRNDEVFVGHSQVFLQPINTLFNLYLNPLFDFLTYVNPVFTVSGNVISTSKDLYSVFYNSPEQPLLLWLDFKTSPNETYDAIRPLLQPFIDNNFLAYYDVEADKLVPGPLVVTITGNLPLEKVEAESKRYTFLDGPLKYFNTSANEAELERWSKLSYVASSSLADLLGDDYESSVHSEFTPSQKNTLGQFFDSAHKYGLKTRIWGDITWPFNLLNSHLLDYYRLGSDLLNVDDLQKAKDLFPAEFVYSTN
ncbi:hypothetical protein G9P44_001518 [Scheffersomyces stipitis]|nr:hypothetical protein G9P44_001518 [Scheffersomyces stipitis]